MMADEQTHTLPEAPHELARVALLAGFPSLDLFSRTLLMHLARVDRRFARLFAGRQEACDVPAVVAALSDETDEEALEWLREAGYRRPQDIAHIVSGWGAARYRAMRSEAAREQLARMLPNILSAFAQGRIPMPRSRSSTGSSPGCRPACNSSPSSRPTHASWISWR